MRGTRATAERKGSARGQEVLAPRCTSRSGRQAGGLRGGPRGKSGSESDVDHAPILKERGERSDRLHLLVE
eukprot:15440148-Alexandrium_andersonii.AAC.1